MAVPPRTATDGTFFLTAITANRRRLFQVETNACLLLDTLQHYRRQGLYKLHAFVVMPDHLHLLLSTSDLPKPCNTAHCEEGGFSHRLASKLDVWPRGYTDHHILSRDDLQIRRAYIDQNPIRQASPPSLIAEYQTNCQTRSCGDRSFMSSISGRLTSAIESQDSNYRIAYR